MELGVELYFNMKKLLLLFFITLTIGINAQVQDSTKKSTTTFKFGGYAKADYIFTQYNNGDVGEASPLRDIHLPSQIPVGISDEHLDGDFHVKESRFNFDVNTDKFGKPIHGFIEMDFLLGNQGDERISNSFNPRLRHFYFEWDRMLFGQTWSNFMIVVIPEDMDFAGAAEGVVFIRQPQIKAKFGSWAFSIENQETTVTPMNESATIVTESGYVPDFTARKNFKGKWGTWSIAAIGRSLNDADSNFTRQSLGYGITTGGKINVGKKGDDLRIIATYGSGLGRYVALGFVSSSVINNKELENINTINGYIAYNHYWNKNWCSSGNVSVFQAENHTTYSSDAVNKIAYSASINLKYKPFKEMMMGIEYMYAYRELDNGVNGDFNRIQFSAKYTFGYNNQQVYEK